MKTTHHCPACWRSVSPTARGQIDGHFDTTDRATCPGSYEPFAITLRKRLPTVTTGPIEHLAELRAHPGQRQPCARCGGRTYVYSTATYTDGQQRHYCRTCSPFIAQQYRWETRR